MRLLPDIVRQSLFTLGANELRAFLTHVWEKALDSGNASGQHRHSVLS